MAALSKNAGVLETRKASHLLRRTTFGPDQATIDLFADKTADEAFDLLTTALTAPDPPVDTKTGLSWLPKPNENDNSDNGTLSNYFKCWWLNQMLVSGANMRERMVFFIHTLFPTIDSAVENATYLYYQNALFRYYALGNLKELTQKVCIDNAMLTVLDGRLNEVYSPNENFARELFELHTIGRGEQVSATDFTNYTEADIKLSARILSGWTSDAALGTDTSNNNIDTLTGIPLGILKGSGLYATRHDASDIPERKFSSAFQNTVISHLPADVVNGVATKESTKAQVNELVDMIFAQEATAKNFCRKIYRFFVYYDITEDVENEVITPLSATLIANNFELMPVLKELLTSEYFYDENNSITTDNTHADIIKSPIDLSLGALRFFGVTPPNATASLSDFYDFYDSLLNDLVNQGIQLYEPYDVAGYDAYHQQPDYNRNWITVNTLAFRYEFGLKLAQNNLFDMVNIDFAAYVKNNVSDVTSTGIVQYFVDYLLPEAISDTGDGNRFDYFLTILRDGLSEVNWGKEWQNYLTTGMNTAIEPQIEDLIAAILKSPEYQLM